MRLFGWSCGFLLFVSLAASAELPPITPQVTSVFPHGALKGQETPVEFSGSHLTAVKAIRFVHPGIEAIVESASFRKVRARVRVQATVETGRHEFRLISDKGLWFGVFWVGSQSESTESEPNDDAASAQRITLPALINGRADGADADYYRFHAKAGQTAVFEVITTRLGSALDPVLALFDSKGKELAYNDDAYAFKDARLAYTFARDGDYALLVSASFERSAKDADYRLVATAGPHLRSALPMGAKRGTRSEVVLHGWNLNAAERVWLGNGNAVGRILERNDRSLRISLEVPSSIAAGASQIHVSGEGIEAIPVRFEIGDLPETTYVDGLRATVPVLVNGQLPGGDDPMKRVHWIEFAAEAGARYEFRVDGWRIGQEIDPVISLYSPGGKLVLQEDDPAPNSFIHHPATHDPRLVYKTDDAGLYRMQIRDAAYQPGGVYRLTIQRVEPSFEAEVRSPQLTAFQGQQTKLLVVVRRTGGVHQVEAFRKPDSEIEHFRIIERDGWNSPIRVRLEGLPDGVSAETVVIEARNTVFKGNDGEELFVDGTIAEVPLRLDDTAQPGLYEIRAIAEGVFEGRSVQRQALVLNGGIRSLRLEPTSEQRLYLNVLKPPPLFWNVPPELQISKGGHGMLRVGIVRFGGEFPVAAEPKATVAGFRVGSARAAAGAEELEIPVEPEEGVETMGQLTLVATFERNGRSERVESPPIELRLK